MSDADCPSRLLLVLGTHRGGASALTRGLGLCGFALPATQLQSNLSARRGPLESQPLVRFNDGLLDQAGLVWSDWTGGATLDLAPEQADELRALVAAEFAPGAPAVLKDPRLARLLPAYRTALGDALALEAVIVLRNPRDCIASLIQRNGLSPLQAALLWLRDMLGSVSASAGMPRAFVAYDALLEAPVAQLEALQSALGTEFPTAPAAAAPEIAAQIDGALQGAGGAADPALEPLTQGWVAGAYDALLALTRDGGDSAALADLARIQGEFEQATPFLAHILGVQAAELAALQRQNGALNAAVELKTIQLSQAREDLGLIDGLRAQVDQLNDDLAAAYQAQSGAGAKAPKPGFLGRVFGRG